MTNATQTALVLVNATATTNGSDLENIGHRGAHVVIDITAITGTTPTATFTVQGKDPVSGKYYTLLASAALNTAATTVLRIYPGLTAAANLVASDIVPRNIRVICTAGGTITDLDATVGVLFV